MTADAGRKEPTLGARLLFTLIAAAFAFVGVVAIVLETHTGYARGIGIRTIVGSDAVWFGQTCLLLAALPMLVWLNKRWVGVAGAVWWVVLMVWIFGPLYWW